MKNIDEGKNAREISYEFTIHNRKIGENKQEVAYYYSGALPMFEENGINPYLTNKDVKDYLVARNIKTKAVDRVEIQYKATLNYQNHIPSKSLGMLNWQIVGQSYDSGTRQLEEDFREGLRDGIDDYIIKNGDNFTAYIIEKKCGLLKEALKNNYHLEYGGSIRFKVPGDVILKETYFPTCKFDIAPVIIFKDQAYQMNLSPLESKSINDIEEEVQSGMEKIFMGRVTAMQRMNDEKCRKIDEEAKKKHNEIFLEGMKFGTNAQNDGWEMNGNDLVYGKIIYVDRVKYKGKLYLYGEKKYCIKKLTIPVADKVDKALAEGGSHPNMSTEKTLCLGDLKNAMLIDFMKKAPGMYKLANLDSSFGGNACSELKEMIRNNELIPEGGKIESIKEIKNDEGVVIDKKEVIVAKKNVVWGDDTWTTD